METQNKTIPYFVAAVVVTILCAAPNWSAADAGSQGKKIWGTWYIIFEGGAGANIPAVATIHRDGTLVSSDGSDFGGPPFPVRQTPIRGVWVGTGGGRFEAAVLYFNGDVVTGQLVHITSGRISFQFEDDFDHISGTVFREIFQCPTPFTCPDPLTAVPDSTLSPIPFQGTRLRVIAEFEDDDDDD